MTAQPTPGQRLIAALESGGDHLLQADKAAILTQADSIADDLVNKAATAFANALPSGGLKNLEFGPVKSAIVASLPQDDAAVNAQIETLFGLLETAIGKAASDPQS